MLVQHDGRVPHLRVVMLDDGLYVHLVPLDSLLFNHLLLMGGATQLQVALLQGIDLLHEILPSLLEGIVVLLHSVVIPRLQCRHAIEFGVLDVEEVCLELCEDLGPLGLCTLTFSTDVTQILLELLPTFACLHFAAFVVLQKLHSTLFLLHCRREALQGQLLHVRQGLQELDDGARSSLLKVPELCHNVWHSLHLSAELQGALLQGLDVLAHLLVLLCMAEAAVRGRVRQHVEVLESYLLGKLLHQIGPEEL
mmetsp:Transcript_41031/g.89656  ORF Transcript_41031/g.89656 Transcript_41031/m.89656 type:complete len:252 (-) Transcript_41031:332-1087(-)